LTDIDSAMRPIGVATARPHTWDTEVAMQRLDLPGARSAAHRGSAIPMDSIDNESLALNRLTAARIVLEMLQRRVPLTQRQRSLSRTALEAIDLLASDLRLQSQSDQTHARWARLEARERPGGLAPTGAASDPGQPQVLG
jgi:hypothetical protein